MPTYILREYGMDFDTVVAETAEEALDCFDPTTGDYDTSNRTIYNKVYAIHVDDCNDYATHTFSIDPEVPSCKDDNQHDWQSPYHLLGGLKENPGVWGNGGGVIINEVCMVCGCLRSTNTWAQDPTTGEQGLESVSYTPHKYAMEIEDS